MHQTTASMGGTGGTHADAHVRRGGGNLPYETTYSPGADAEPYRLIFTGNGFEITAKVTSAEVADDLVRAINALKLLLRPVDGAKLPDPEATHSVPTAEPLMGRDKIAAQFNDPEYLARRKAEIERRANQTPEDHPDDPL